MTYYELNQWNGPIDDLYGWDRNPTVKTAFVVPSESREIAHLVREVECLAAPTDDADDVADQTTVYVCSCEDFEYNRWHDADPGRIEHVPQCKHVGKIKPEKAESDQSQVTLGNSGP